MPLLAFLFHYSLVWSSYSGWFFLQYNFPRHTEIFGNMLLVFIAIQAPNGKGGI